ncbi:50S ribosomal protein L14, chloroplastic [Apostasia shenzhenica]|uniref:50S ribosomal protein L14, chloroplastic n=1 Tax=Apostasia shenzhenica TaxID=1088818 RepID=A0A2I0BBR4_9ASPA|nr:50S ribosomal protein L14, chloroplastic [Apostasia shenzhenica]
MIQPQTLLNIADNSKTRELICIRRPKFKGPISKKIIFQPKARRPNLIPRSLKLNVPH